MLIIGRKHNRSFRTQFLHFHFVKALAIHTLHICHRNEGIRVDELNHTEDVDTFALTSQTDNHLALRLGVPTCTVEHGHASTCGIDGIGNLGVVAGENQELHRLSLAVHHIVEREGRDEQRGITKHKSLHVVEDKPARGNDDDIAHHNHIAQRHIAVLVHDGCDDIRATRRTVVEETDGKTKTFNNRSDDTRHECLVLHEWARKTCRRVVAHDSLHQPENEGEHQNGIDGLDAEFPSQFLDGNDEEHHIDNKVCVLHLESMSRVHHVGDEIDNRRNTRYASRGDTVGKHETGEGKGIEQEGDCNHQVIASLKRYVLCKFWNAGLHY